MTVSSDTFWVLPGPATFVQDVRGAAARGQHVAAVLPKTFFERAEFLEALTSELLRMRNNLERLYVDDESRDLLDCLGRSLFLAEPPVTVRTFIVHEELQGRRLLLSALDLPSGLRQQLPEFFRRLIQESRSIPEHERVTIAILTDREHVPNSLVRIGSEVAFECLWFWNRLAKWDIAALVSQWISTTDGGSLFREIRLETIVEIARWDLDLAERMCRNWGGEPSAVRKWLGGSDSSLPQLEAPSRRDDSRIPPIQALEHWDCNAVAFWHGAVVVAPRHLDLDQYGIDRLVWNAQSRILLPWIEVVRDALYGRAIEKFGSEMIARHVAKARARSRSYASDEVVEIGVLAHIFKQPEFANWPAFGETAGVLRDARNSMAHLRPVSSVAIHELSERSLWLR